MRTIFLTTIIVLILVEVSLSQNNSLSLNRYDFNSIEQENKNEKKVRNIFLFSSIGVLEIISVGIGYQITDNFSLSLKGSVTGFEGGAFNVPNSTKGLGIKLTYYCPFIFLNTISFEYTLHLDANFDYLGRRIHKPSLKGSFFDFNIGKESINEAGFNFFWSVGFCINSVKYVQILYSPSIKIGLNFNFIKKE